MATQALIDKINDAQLSIEAASGYRTSSDRTQVADYVSNVTFLIHVLPSVSASGGNAGEEIRYDLPTLRLMLEAATKYLDVLDHRAASSGGGFVQRGTVPSRRAM